MSRTELLHALAWTLPDVQPAPKTGALRGAQRGESPSAWALCGTCDGRGWRQTGRERRATCETCGGAGRYRVDPFTLERPGHEQGEPSRRGRRVGCDRCGGSGVMLARYAGEGRGMAACTTCAGSGSVVVELDPGEEPRSPAFDGSALSRARSRGDWDALEEALGVLRELDRGRWRSWVRVRVAGELAVSPGEAARLVDVDRWMLGGLPDPLRVPADALVAFRARARYAALRDACRVERVAQGRRRGKRTRVRELIARGYAVADAAALAGVNVRTAQRAALELADARRPAAA